VQLTRDGGKTWSNVTAKGLPPGQINSIEVSPHDKATAYIAFFSSEVERQCALHLQEPTIYGQSWTPIVTGLPADEAVRVVREGPRRRGLLYAGTETGIFVSFNDGTSWQSLQAICRACLSPTSKYKWRAARWWPAPKGARSGFSTASHPCHNTSTPRRRRASSPHTTQCARRSAAAET